MVSLLIFKDGEDDSVLQQPKREEEEVLDQGELSFRVIENYCANEEPVSRLMDADCTKTHYYFLY